MAAAALGMAAMGYHPAAGAQAKPEIETVALSLEQALSLAETRSPDVVMARHWVNQNLAREVGAGIVMPTNPRLSGDFRRAVNGRPSTLGYAATLDMMFDVGGAPGARIREARGYADLSRSELDLGRLEAKASAWSAYVRVRVSENRITGFDDALRIAERVRAASERRTELGAAGDIEGSLAVTEVGELQAGMQQAISRRDLSLMDLRQALDLPAGAHVVLTTTIEDPGPVADLPTLMVRAVKARPELAVIKKKVELLKLTDERLAKEVFPKMGAYAGVDATPDSPTLGLIGLSVELPFAQRNQGPRAVAQAELGGEQERHALEMRRIARDVAATRTAYEGRRAELKVLDQTALPAAQRTLELVEAGWRAGRFDLFRVTTAARDITRLRSRRLDAIEGAWLERIALFRAVGGQAI
jgi:outer membrane protein, heavy metal efflux system